MDKNAQCLATLSTAVKDTQGNNLQKDYSWSYSTEPRDECVLEACEKLYSDLLVWLNDPNLPNKFYIPEGTLGGSGKCVALPKNTYLNLFWQDVTNCIPLLKDENAASAWLNSIKNWNWIEGTQGCQNPYEEETWQDELLFFTTDANYITQFNSAMQTNFDANNSLLICGSLSDIGQWKTACSQNTCGQIKISPNILYNFK